MEKVGIRVRILEVSRRAGDEFSRADYFVSCTFCAAQLVKEPTFNPLDSAMVPAIGRDSKAKPLVCLACRLEQQDEKLPTGSKKSLVTMTARRVFVLAAIPIVSYEPRSFSSTFDMTTTVHYGTVYETLEQATIAAQGSTENAAKSTYKPKYPGSGPRRYEPQEVTMLFVGNEIYPMPALPTLGYGQTRIQFEPGRL